MAKARAARGKGKKRVNENRPFYVLVGEERNSEAQEILCMFPTVGRVRRYMDEMPNFLVRHYKNLEVWRCKVADL